MCRRFVFEKEKRAARMTARRCSHPDEEIGGSKHAKWRYKRAKFRPWPAQMSTLSVVGGGAAGGGIDAGYTGPPGGC